MAHPMQIQACLWPEMSSLGPSRIIAANLAKSVGSQGFHNSFIIRHHRQKITFWCLAVIVMVECGSNLPTQNQTVSYGLQNYQMYKTVEDVRSRS